MFCSFLLFVLRDPAREYALRLLIESTDIQNIQVLGTRDRKYSDAFQRYPFHGEKIEGACLEHWASSVIQLSPMLVYLVWLFRKIAFFDIIRTTPLLSGPNGRVSRALLE